MDFVRPTESAVYTGIATDIRQVEGDIELHRVAESLYRQGMRLPGHLLQIRDGCRRNKRDKVLDGAASVCQRTLHIGSRSIGQEVTHSLPSIGGGVQVIIESHIPEELFQIEERGKRRAGFGFGADAAELGFESHSAGFHGKAESRRHAYGIFRHGYGRIH